MSRYRSVKRWGLILSSVYIAGGLILYLIQDLLLFHPQPLSRTHTFAFEHPFEEMNIPVEGRNLNLVKFLTPANKKGIVLYFHGNMRNIERYAPVATLFTKQGYELWMMDYPGFGKSTGKRTEQNMYADALLVYDLAAKEQAPQNLIIYGRSMGTGIAAYLSMHRESRHLLLETPYYSIEALARYYIPIYPVKSLMNYELPNYQYLQGAKAPVTIYHGTEDEVVPYKHSLRLKQEHPGITLHTIPGGRHNNLIDYDAYTNALEQVLIH